MDRNSKVKLQRHTTLASCYGFDVSRPQFRGSFSVIQRFLIIPLRNQGGKRLQLQIRSESCIGGDKLITAEPPLTATSLQQSQCFWSRRTVQILILILASTTAESSQQQRDKTLDNGQLIND